MAVLVKGADRYEFSNPDTVKAFKAAGWVEVEPEQPKSEPQKGKKAAKAKK